MSLLASSARRRGTVLAEGGAVVAPAGAATRQGGARTWHAVLAAGVAATAAFALAPSGSAYQLAAWAVPFVLAAVLLTARVRVAPTQDRRPLRLLLAGALLYVGASLVWYVAPIHVGAVLPFPSPLNAAFFAAYACYAGFLVLALRRRASDAGLGPRLAVVDAAILTLAVTAPLWMTVIEPNLTNGTPALPTVVALLYPAVQLLLFGLAAQLLLTVGWADRGAAALLLLWIGGELAGDVFYGVQSVGGTFRYDGPLIPLWMLAYTGLAAFAAHPGSGDFLQPPATAASAPRRVRRLVPNPVRRPVRLGVLLLAALVPLALAALTTGQDLALLGIAAVTVALALYRASLLAGDLQEQRRLSAERDEALAKLRAQHLELARLAVIVESTSDAVVTWSPDGEVLTWNHGAQMLYGYSSEEAVGQDCRSFLPVQDRQSYDVTAALLLEHGHHTTESMVVHKSGSTVEVAVTLSVLRDDAGQTLVGISRDVTERNRLQRELAAQVHRLDEAQRVAGLGSWDWDLGTGTVTWSAQLYRLMGLDEGTDVSPELFLTHVHPDDRSETERAIHRADDGMDFVTRIVRPDGEVRSLAVRGELVRDADGVAVRKTGTAQDVSDRITLQSELAARVRQLDEAQRLAGVGSFEHDLTTGRDLWSAELYRILDLDETAGAGSYETMLARIHPEDRAAVEGHNAAAGPDRPMEYETRMVRGDGEVRWLHVHAEVLPRANGVGRRVSGSVHDITERKSAETEMARLALTDTLTGLPNRHRLTALLQSALNDAGGGRAAGLLLLDLDGFKDVNDGIGHHAGDRVLQEVARRVSAVLRDGQQVARLGGDEFAVVLSDVDGVEGAVSVAARVRSCLEPAFDLDGITVHVGGSIGIAVSADCMDTGVLLKQADVAMYRAKTLSSGWAVFEPDQDDVAAGRLRMVTDLRATIERGDLHVAYQPVLDTRTRRVSSFEALARWQHPDKGVIPPDQFIPLAEQADLIVPLTRLVLRKAAAACARWRSAGHDVRVAVNLSVQVMQHTDARALVADVLADADLTPQHLILEITEGSLATDADRVTPALTALHDLGVTLSIDDFGTGYSAMSYLKELPVEELKIDRSFVRDIASDTRDLAIVRSLIRLAHSLGLRVVAEGVESKQALEVLTALGCDFAQGYGIARPMRESDTVGWLARYPLSDAPRVADRPPTDLLIVDDSSVVRAQLSHLAEQAGWRVRRAASAEEALAEVERSIPDVVILDHHMTGMSGMASVPELRARGLDGPILLFTHFLSDAIPSQRMPLDVWPVSKTNPGAVLELLDGYRTSARRGGAAAGG